MTVFYPTLVTSLIRKLNPNKANGSDGMSGQMLLLCDDSVALPLRIIFRNILSTATYPDIWKHANVIPILSLTISTDILLHIT